MANEEMLPPLSYGALSDILNLKTVNSVTLQVLGYKRVPGPGRLRFRLLLNDGMTLFPFGILANQLTDMIEAKNLEKFSIIKLNRYACTEIQSKKKIILCLEIDPIVPGAVVKKQISLPGHNCTQMDLLNTSDLNNSFDTQSVLMSNNNNLSVLNSNQSLHGTYIPQHPSENKDQDKFKVPKPYFDLNKNSNEKVLNIASNSTHKVNYSDSDHGASSSSSMRNHTSPPGPSNSKSSDQAGDKSSLNVSSTPGQHKHIMPIINLTPYQTKWVLQGRVTYKTPLVHYNNRKSAGKMFSFYLLDETGEIRVLAFQEQAEHLCTFLEQGKTYYISNAEVQLARGDSPLKCDYEIKVTENTSIEVSNDEVNIPTLKFNFVPLNELESLPKDTFVDVIGACYNFSHVQTMISKVNGREITKRDVFLMDESKTIMMVTIWGSYAESVEVNEDNSVIAIRNARISGFKGCSLSVNQVSMLFVNPDISQAHQLRTWFREEGSAFKSEAHTLESSNEIWNTIADIRSFEMEDSDVSQYFTVEACVTMVQKEKCMYQSCPDPDCQKKVQDIGNSLFKCSKCNKDYDSFTWTMLLSLDISDFTGSIWVTAFRDIAESIIGMNSDQLSKLRDENIDEFYRVLTNLQFQSFVFRLRSKVEVFNDTKQLKTIVLEAEHSEPLSLSRKLLTNIYRMEKILNPIL